LKIVDVRRGAAPIRFHPEQHRHGLINGKILQPAVPKAPGGKCGDRQRKIGRHLLANLEERIPVKLSLRARGVEVDLHCRNPGFPRWQG
jgi:hypothetical protein